MLKQSLRTLIAVVILTLILLVSCKHEKYENTHPIGSISNNATDTTKAVGCGDLSAVSFSLQVQPLINGKCVSCHDATSIPRLDNYHYIKLADSTGQLMGTITSDPNYIHMPPGDTLDSCAIKMLVKWTEQGMLNN